MRNKYIFLISILFSLVCFDLKSKAEVDNRMLYINVHLYDPSDDSIIDKANLDIKEFDIYDITRLVKNSDKDFIDLQKEFLSADEKYMSEVIKEAKKISYDKTENRNGTIRYRLNSVSKDIQYMMILENKNHKQSVVLNTSPMIIKLSDSISEAEKDKLELYPKLYQDVSQDRNIKILYKNKGSYLLPRTGEVKNMMFYIGLLAVGSTLYIKRIVGRNINEK